MVFRDQTFHSLDRRYRASMLFLIFSVIFILGGAQGILGDDCPPLETSQCPSDPQKCLQCMAVLSNCMVSATSNITLRDGTVCPACTACIRLLPRPRPWRNPGVHQATNPCPPSICPMLRVQDGCDLQSYTQWVNIGGRRCHAGCSWRCK